MDWNVLWKSISNYFSTSGLNILNSLCVLIVGFIVAKLISKLIRLVLSKTKIEATVQTFFTSIIVFVLNLFVVVMALRILGVSSTSMIALLSAAGLAVSLALQNSLSNLANGIVIVFTKPFKKGDYISIDGVEGSVQNIRMLTTAIASADNKLIILPNSIIVTKEIINYSARNVRRISFSFNVAYETDVDKAKRIVLDVMNSCEKVREKDPKPPFVALKSLGDSSIEIYANCWCESGDYWDVHYFVMDKVFNEFKKNNISIPYNQLEVRLRNDEVVMPFRNEELNINVKKKAIIEQKSLFTKFIDFNKEQAKIGAQRLQTMKERRIKEKEQREIKRKKKQQKKEIEKIDTIIENTPENNDGESDD